MSGQDFGPTEEQMTGYAAGIPVSQPPTAEPLEDDATDHVAERSEAEGVMPQESHRDADVPTALPEDGAP